MHQLAAHHRADNRLFVEIRPPRGEDVFAVAQHGDAVGDAEDLGQAVRHVDHPHPACGQRTHQLQQAVDLGLAERGGGLIHHHHAGIESQRPGDLDQLLLGHRQIAHDGVGVQVDLEPADHLGAAPVHGQPVDAQPAGGFAVDEDVLRHGQVRQQVEFLEDHVDAGPLRAHRVGQHRGLALDLEHAAGRLQGSGQEVDQRRFSRAVLTHQRVDFAGKQVEIDVAERQNTGEAAADVAHLQERRRRWGRVIHDGSPPCGKSLRTG